MKAIGKLTTGQKALMRKDFAEVWKTPMLRNTLLLLPAILMVVMPVAFLLAAYFAPLEQMNGMAEIHLFCHPAQLPGPLHILFPERYVRVIKKHRDLKVF